MIRASLYVPDPIKDLGSRIRLDVIASRHHDEAHDSEENHQGKALWSTPDVKYLG